MEDDKEICRENTCWCLYNVLVEGDDSEECVFPIENSGGLDRIMGGLIDYEHHAEDYDDPERLVILSLDARDSFIIGDMVYTKVLRIMDGRTIFNTSSLERFDMRIFLMKYNDDHYLAFGTYAFYHRGVRINVVDCPPEADTIADAYGQISDVHHSLILVLKRLTRAYIRLRGIASIYAFNKQKELRGF